ncbi:MAG: NAD(P)-dependent oxidoreductase [Candidatus Paceibacterota bacterium]
MFDKKVLLIGAGGLLGQAIVAEYNKLFVRKLLSFFLIHRNKKQLDITNRIRIEEAISVYSPNIIINASGYTNVDGAEKEPELCNKINGIGVRNLAEAANHLGIKVIHISSDYVFSGSARKPYAIDAQFAPINTYGNSKAVGEINIRSTLDPAFYKIIRTSSLFGPYKENFLYRLIRRIVISSDLTAPIIMTDKMRTAITNANELARFILNLCEHDHLYKAFDNTIHFTNTGSMTRYELAKKVIHGLGVDEHVLRKGDFVAKESAAKRPTYSVLDLSKTVDRYTVNSCEHVLDEYIKTFALYDILKACNVPVKQVSTWVKRRQEL